MAAILRLVPYVGAVVAAALPFVLSLAVFDSWTPPLLVFLLFAALELVTGNFIEPMLYGAHTGISALALLLTTVFWTALWGPAGLVLSTPLTVCVVVLGRYVPQFSFLHIILGDETVLAPEASVYQRLLAMDDQDARAVADLYLDDHSLPELYDAVIDSGALHGRAGPAQGRAGAGPARFPVSQYQRDGGGVFREGGRRREGRRAGDGAGTSRPHAGGARE